MFLIGILRLVDEGISSVTLDKMQGIYGSICWPSCCRSKKGKKFSIIYIYEFHDE